MRRPSLPRIRIRGTSELSRTGVTITPRNAVTRPRGCNESYGPIANCVTVRAVAQPVPDESIRALCLRSAVLFAITPALPQKRICGIRIAPGRAMHAHELEGEGLPGTERPTIPVPAPRESGVRLRVARKSVAPVAATVELVVCDLTRDRRSEAYVPDEQRDGGEPQTVRQPAMTNIRALLLAKCR